MNRVFICDYRRTPIGRYGGALASVRPDDLAAIPIRNLVERTPALVEHLDEVILGCANQAGEDNRNVARMAVLLSGLPITVPAHTVNRLCASGLDAVTAAYRAIKCGEAGLIIAGGVESMSRAPFVMPKAEAGFSRANAVYDTTIGWRFVNKLIEKQYGIDSMPETAENVAADYGVSREDQDAVAFSSQTRAAQAQESGRLAEEIVPVTMPQRRGDPVSVERDEHPRLSPMEKLAALPTPFREAGTVTAGNASGVNDGAAALLIASEEMVDKLGLTPMAEVTGAAAAGVEPRVMGIGPVPAVQKLCAMTGQDVADFDVIELNEAFAAQAVAVCRELGLDPMAAHINPNGGAIALGHPLGMTGARLVGTAAVELTHKGQGTALCTMCVGVGQGAALSLRSVA
ncbi:3-oxoadipyl-CoA thiolase [Fontisubflavum oceani]|uniref:3-oxoadipyl-CoA thiolase n=1 Tax=Fontisubflavum oceani TaxID=2978973 RepID=UPI0025B580C2|nr:3-oxoadipyl-CoA thiolase [Fontisubflavum oceani]WJY20234.1 3-oxoadipyl-CoA thiolase [Fontisubflavum oceani]